ncbi:MAG TPA: hypothetical protein VJ935_09125 [Acidimicrobiia bacterium]|nr:hypothetical protein [Acidimicrobiia bacterium]
MKQLSPLEAFVVSVGHGARKQRMHKALLPEGALVPIELDLLDVMTDLDPGMIDWDPLVA